MGIELLGQLKNTKYERIKVHEMNVGRGYVMNVGRAYVIQNHELINLKGGHRAARAANKNGNGVQKLGIRGL